MLLKRFFILTLILGWLTGCVIVISTSVGYTPFRIGSSSKNNAFQIIPQGWGFFTRNPREAILVVYQKSGDSLHKITQPNFSSANLYGLSRKGRLRQMQFGNLILPYNSQWQNCTNMVISECVADTVHTVENSFQPSSPKGEFFIQKKATLPWAWSRNRKALPNPYEFLVIDVQ